MEPGDLVKYNAAIRLLAKNMVAGGLDHMLNMGVTNTGNLFKKLKSRVKYMDFQADLIQVTMPRYGFIQMSQGGLGSKRVAGSPMKKGKEMRGGTPRPFARDGIDEHLEELADFVASFNADDVSKKTEIRLRG